MAKGVDDRDVFLDESDRRSFLAAMDRVSVESGAEILAYCLMGNHFHIAIRVSSVPLALIMQRLLTGYSLAFNIRHERTGHLYQARYRAILCLDDAYLAVLIRYIHQNPVRAGFVADPGEWPWSSFRSCGGTAETSIPADFNPWPSSKQEYRSTRFVDGPQLGLEEIGIRVQAQTGIAMTEMRSMARRRRVVAARRAVTCEAIRNGHLLHVIATWLNTTTSSVTRYAQKNTVSNGRPDT